ncbi:MAG: hypothetical protein ACSLFD_05900 [Solirubrobacterales bacterium]
MPPPAPHPATAGLFAVPRPLFLQPCAPFLETRGLEVTSHPPRGPYVDQGEVMNRFGKLVSVVSITATMFLLGSLPGPANARQATVLDFDYSGKLGTVRTDIDRDDNRLEILVTMKLDCGKTTKRAQGRVFTKVDPQTGKFRHIAPADERKVHVGAEFTDIKGRISENGNVSGRVGMVESDHFSVNYTCSSGKSLKNLWEPFKAKTVDPTRFTIYTYRSDDLRITFAVNGRQVYVASLRDRRTCTGGPKNWPDGWGAYTPEGPLEADGNGAFGFELSSESDTIYRMRLRAKIRSRNIWGSYLFKSRSESENKNGPLKCSTGESYSNPVVKFKAELVN